MISEQPATLATRDGVALEARIAEAPDPPGGVVLCHPHPLYGGDMDNPVVVRCQEVSSALALSTLRFNFRGVGRSTGSHGDGIGERLDLEAALARLGALTGGTRIALVGYSFGASVAAQVAAADARLAGLCLIAPPLGLEGGALPAALGSLPSSLMIVGGSRDQYCPRAALDALAGKFPGARGAIVDGADHFFLGKLFSLGEIVGEWLRSVFPPGPHPLQPGKPGGGGGAG